MLPFGQTLWLWRQQRGLTQAALAHRARLSRPNLSAIERGRRDVTLRTLRLLAATLGVRPGVLVEGLPPPADGGAAPFLSREAIERMADAAALGRPSVKPTERAVVAALRTILQHRLRAARRRWSRPRGSRRAATAAWMMLKSLYSQEAIRTLAERVVERQRIHDSSRH